MVLGGDRRDATCLISSRPASILPHQHRKNHTVSIGGLSHLGNIYPKPFKRPKTAAARNWVLYSIRNG